MDILMEYYLVDWVAIALSLYSMYLLGNKVKFGFLLFAFSNLMWIFLGFTWMNSVGMAIGNIVFFLINIRGYYRWQHHPADVSNASSVKNVS